MAYDEEYIEQLILDELAGTLSPEDSATLKRLLEEEPGVVELRNTIRAQFEGEEEQEFLNRPSAELPFQQVMSKIQKRKWVRVYIRTTYTLLTLFIVSGIGYMLFKPQQQATFLPPHTVALQLPNGETVALSNNPRQVQVGDVQLQNQQKKLTYISGKASSSVVTLLVPPGKDYTIQLSDGTEIQLNAASRLRFPASFTGDTREVSIDGEAYLKVAPDAHRPFILHLPQSTVRVLGTEFNVNSYDSTKVQVALVQGAVEMATNTATKRLQPGQAIVSDKMQLTNFDADDVLSWRQGIYVFHAVAVSDMCRVVTRWFGIQVVYDNPATGRRRFTGYIDRNKPVSNFLNALQATDNFDYYFDRDSVLHIR